MAQQPRREVSWREWCAPEKREKLVTRGELLTWVDRIVSDIREDFTPWYVKLWRKLTTRKKPELKIEPKAVP